MIASASDMVPGSWKCLRSGLVAPDPLRDICLARVVVPRPTAAPLMPSAEFGREVEEDDGKIPPVGKLGDETGEGELSAAPNRVWSQQSRHHITPSDRSPFAAESNFFPHPGLLGALSSRPVHTPLARLLAAVLFPPHTRQAACHFVAPGPGTIPLSIGDTVIRQPGHEVAEPNRGTVVDPEIPAPAPALDDDERDAIEAAER